MDIKTKILAVMLVVSGLVAITGIQSSTNSGDSTLNSVIPVGNNIGPSDYSRMESVSPVGAEVEEESDYRFSNNDGNIVYGPYHVEGEKYYYYDGSVLDSEFSSTTKPEVKGLHNFYLKTYTDPLFYSPAESDSAYNFSSVNAAETGKLLTQECGLEYDVVPEKYHSNLSKNVEVTEQFLEHASLENANNLIEQNKQTTSSYSDMVGNYVDLLSKDLSDNSCFGEDAEYSGLNVETPTPEQIKINDEVLINVFRMANENSEQLNRDIESRSQLLDGAPLNLTSPNVTLDESTSPAQVDYTPEEAVEEMNIRRAYEKHTLGTTTQYDEDYGLEDGDEEPVGDDPNADEFEDDDSETVNYTEDDESVNYTEDSQSGQTYEDTVDTGDETGIDENYNTFQVESLDNRTRENLKTVSEVPRAYDLKSACVSESTVPVYGWDKNVYPNIISGKELEFSSSAYVDEQIAPNIFSSCNCPNAGLTRLSWYVVDGAYEEIEGDRLFTQFEGEIADKIQTAENVFLTDPGQEKADQLGDTYHAGLVDNLEKNRYSSDIPEVWERSTRQRSKLEKLERSYDDFYNERHMDIWRSYFNIEEGEKVPRQQYNYFFTTESLYMMDIMPWSDSVWRLEEQPPQTVEALN